ncbi:MAG: hypothetical protein JST01_24295 [Cyanobacteria bacterium SZAS TMP-1]|nr:hypothetical protein [Cyanobacteria bacterium SZAS TMP-1]
MGVFGNEENDYRERQAIFYANNPDAPAGQFEQQARQQAYSGDGRFEQTQQQGGSPRPDVSTRIMDYIQPKSDLIGADGRTEQIRPIHAVQKFDSRGNRVGTSEYVYHDNQRFGAIMDAYVDRDAAGHISEFAVRKPKTDPNQKDVFMVFRSTPENPISEQQMKHVVDLLRTDRPAAERAANQAQLNAERPLEANLVNNVGKQITAIDLDPQTGQRFVVRDMAVPVNTNPPSSTLVPFLCWDGPNRSTYRYPVAQMPPEDKADVANARWHGNMRTPLRFLYEGGQSRTRPNDGGSDPYDRESNQPIIRPNRVRR